MATFFAPRALLADGWRHQVRITVNDAGIIERVTPDSDAHDAIRLPGVTLPSVANLHSHAFQRAMAGLAEVAGDPQDSFWTWRDLMYRMVQRLTPEQVGAIAAYLYIDMLPVLYSHSGFGAQPPLPGQKRFIQQTDAWLRQQERLAASVRDKPLLNRGLCFHSLRAVSETQMREALAASDTALPVHIHVAEQEKEVNDCLAWSGERPVEWLLNRFEVDARWCLIHATHLDAREIAQLAASRAVAGLCPTTEANLGDGIFPAAEFIAQGGRWGIGSDSHVSLSALEELRWLEYGQRLRDRRRNRITTAEQPSVGDLLWRGAALGGAQACGVALGELSPGKRADWLVLAEDEWLDSVGDEALLNRWLFAGQREQIREVWVAGRAVIEAGRHAAEERCAAAFRQAMAALR